MADNIFELANEIGFDEIDKDISTWIKMGEFDEPVKERATVLGWEDTGVEPEVDPMLVRMDKFWQMFHRLMHPDGPYGWEFCHACSKAKHVV